MVDPGPSDKLSDSVTPAYVCLKPGAGLVTPARWKARVGGVEAPGRLHKDVDEAAVRQGGSEGWQVLRPAGKGSL